MSLIFAKGRLQQCEKADRLIFLYYIFNVLVLPVCHLCPGIRCLGLSPCCLYTSPTTNCAVSWSWWKASLCLRVDLLHAATLIRAPPGCSHYLLSSGLDGTKKTITASFFHGILGLFQQIKSRPCQVLWIQKTNISKF